MLPVRSAVAVSILALAVAASGCGKSDSTAQAQAPSAAPAAGAGATVAEVDGVAVTADEVDRKAEGELQQLRDQEYEIRKRALDRIITDRMLDREAQARGVNRDELLRQEVELKVSRPSPAEIDEVWEANKHRVGGRPKSDFVAQIERSIVQERLEERANAFQEELRAKSKVKVTLEQPRTAVDMASGAPAMGPANAPVTIVEFSDYLCPYCQRAEDVVQKVLAKHQGRVRFVHRDFLIGKPRSLEVARAASCAGDQGRFWEYRKDLLLTSGDWSDRDLAARAARLGLNASAFTQCLASTKHDAAIQASTEGGARLGVSATPTFFVNGRRLQGARSESAFDEIIEEELARRKG